MESRTVDESISEERESVRLEEALFVNYRDGTVLSSFEEGRAVLVGSSGRVLLGGFGEEIDKYDHIFRMNTAPTKGFEKFVGSKTDVRIVAFNAVGKIIPLVEMMRGVKMVFIWGSVDKLKGCLDQVKWGMKRYPNVQFYMITPYAYQLVVDQFEKAAGMNLKVAGAWLSTGIIGIFLMKELFGGKFDIIGFGDMKGDGVGAKLPYHYWKDHLADQSEQGHYMNSQMANVGHRFMTEKMIILRWARECRFKFLD